MDARAMVEAQGGCAHSTTLRGLGLRPSALTHAVRNGTLIRARRGWYVTWAADDPATVAIRAGGRLTGISAVRHWGGWVLGAHPVHVSVPDNAARNRHRRGSARLHWERSELLERGTASCVDVADAMTRVIRDESFERAVAALDWAVHSGRITRARLRRSLVATALDTSVLDAVDPACESLPESLSRTRLIARGHKVQSQVRLSGGRIDLVVDGVIGLETDGEEYHRDAFEADRRKDMTMVMAGYLPLRVPARMVFTEWTTVLGAIDAALSWTRSPGGNSGRTLHPIAD